MKELSDQIVAEEKDSMSNSIQVASPPSAGASQSPRFNQSNDDPFANDDSFLVMCSQAIETKASDHNANTKQKVRKPQSVHRAMPVPPKFELSPGNFKIPISQFPFKVPKFIFNFRKSF